MWSWMIRSLMTYSQELIPKTPRSLDNNRWFRCVLKENSNLGSGLAIYRVSFNLYPPVIIQCLTLDDEVNSRLKILGMHWNPTLDQFSYNCQIPSTLATKRSILSDLARIFDSLGFLVTTNALTHIYSINFWTISHLYLQLYTLLPNVLEFSANPNRLLSTRFRLNKYMPYNLSFELLKGKPSPTNGLTSMTQSILSQVNYETSVPFLTILELFVLVVDWSKL